MKGKVTDIKLTSEDTAIVFRGDGRLELFLRNVRGKDDNQQPTKNEITAFVISNLLKDPKWLSEQMDLFENKKNTGQI